MNTRTLRLIVAALCAGIVDDLATLLEARERFADAAAHLRALCAKKKDWMVVHILLGKCLLAEGNRDEAKQLLEHARLLAVEQHHDGPREELEALLGTL